MKNRGGKKGNERTQWHKTPSLNIPILLSFMPIYEAVIREKIVIFTLAVKLIINKMEKLIGFEHKKQNIKR